MEYNRFKDYFHYQVHLNPSYAKDRPPTYRQLAERLGSISPSLITMIAKGERLPSQNLLKALLREWKISSAEASLVKMKVELEKRQLKNKDSLELLKKLSKLQSRIGYKEATVAEFELISEWYIVVLRSMVGTPAFTEDLDELSMRLRRKVSPAKLKHGLEVLFNLGIIYRDPRTGALAQNFQNMHSGSKVPSEAIRKHHRQMIQRGLEAIDEQDLVERVLSGLTLNLESERFHEAQDRIVNFIKSFNEEFGQNNSENIYQLNLQFFKHTSGRKNKGQPNA